MNRRIAWDRLVLRGFGRYRHGVQITLNGGLNNLVAPNEHGKSTLVAGLIAVLFGLPNTSDPGKFGKARFQNWDGADRFEGEVLFRVNGDTYRVQRDFHTDRVTIARRTDARWELLAGGEHRAGARKKNLTYIETLEQLIGIASADLFWSTFFVGQPLPRPGELHQNIQQLLSGTGTDGGQALTWLENRLKDLTRYTGRLGVTGQDMRRDRELEQRMQEREQLLAAIQRSRASVDALHGLQKQISLLGEERNSLLSLRSQKEGLYNDWSRWRALRDRYHNAVQEQIRLGKAQREATRLEGQCQEIVREIARLYPEFLTAPAGLGDQLDRLISLEGEIRRIEEEMSGLRQAKADLEEAAQQLVAEMSGPLAPAQGRPHLVRDHAQLLEALRQRDELAHRLAELVEREVKARAAVAETTAWDRLDGSPPSMYRQAALLAMEKYRDLQALRQELAEKRGQLEGRYGVFLAASPEMLAACRDYHTRRADLERQLVDARSNHRQAADRVAQYVGARDKIHRQFADLGDISAEMIPLLDARLELEVKRQEITEKVTARSARSAIVPLVAGVAMMLLAAITYTAGLWPVALLLLVSGLGTGLWGLLGGRRGAAAQPSQLDGVLAELASVEARLGPLAGRSAVQLAAIRERVKQREQHLAELAVLASTIPADEELVLLAEHLRSTEDQLAVLDTMVRPVAGVLGDPSAAYRDWHQLQAAVASLEQRVTAQAQRDFGVLPDEVEVLPAGTGEWAGVSVLAALTGDHLATVGEAVHWLNNLPPNQWEVWQADYARWQSAIRELETCAIQRRELEQPDATGQNRLTRLEENITFLRQAIHPLTELTPAVEVKQLVEAYGHAERSLEAKRTEFHSLETRLATLTKRLAGLQEERQALTTRLAAVLAPAGGAAEKARERWQHWQEREKTKKEAADSLDGLLRGWGVESLEELEVKAADAANSALEAKGEWQRLIDSRPGLPGAEMAEQREHLEREYRALEQEIRELKDREIELNNGIFNLNKELSALMGRETINIAAAGDRVAELDREIAKMEMETRALALAYRELQEARDLFGKTHRERLAATASRYFAEITGITGRQVLLDTDFRVQVAEPDGQPVEVEQLSQGAQDQLQISLRLAIADLIAGDYSLPMVFDDSFLNCDERRLGSLRETLERLAQHRQMLVLSHQEDYRRWGTALQVNPLE